MKGSPYGFPQLPLIRGRGLKNTIALVNDTSAVLTLGTKINALAGFQAASGSLNFQGQGWSTTAPAHSIPVEWRFWVLPTQAAAASSTLRMDYSDNGAAFVQGWQMTASGASKFFAPAASSSGQVGLSLIGDGISRIAIDVNSGGVIAGTGRLGFGDGTSSRDTFFIRAAAGTLHLLNGTATTSVSLGLYNTATSSTSYELLRFNWAANVAQIWTEKGSGGGTARALVLGADSTELMRFGSSTTLSFFAAAAVVKQTGVENVTNSVTAGGVDGTIANYTDLVIYANDAAAIRNDIYQLARSLAHCKNALRAYGLLT